MTSETDSVTESLDKPLELEAQLCFALYSTQLAMSKLYRRLLRELNLTYSQYLVMMVLWEGDRRTVSGIGERLALDSATLTPLLKRLESARLLTRRRSRQDERQVEIALTKEGDALRQQASSVPITVEKATGFSREELKGLRDQLQRLRVQLDSSG